jgi:AmmeMemoRadiSam system protein A
VTFSPAARAALLHVARAAIRRKLAGDPGEPPDVRPEAGDDPLAAELIQPVGCFVSLHERRTRRLRGCVGRLDASHPACRAVHRAAESALEDPRFLEDPIVPEELPALELEVSLLSPLREVVSPMAFEPAEHGIYLVVRDRAGCFLPQVARETGWDRQQLLSRLCTEKLGVPPLAWRDPDARLHVFATLVLGPVTFDPARIS